jgi:hypothetical protein
VCVPVKKKLSGRIAGIDMLTDEERAALDLYDPEIVCMRLLASGAGPYASLPGFNVKGGITRSHMLRCRRDQ